MWAGAWRAPQRAGGGGEGHVPGLGTGGHGSNVGGRGAGNGSAVGRYGGVAAEADLIVVKFPFEQEGDPAAHEFFTQFDPELQGSLIDAATYIYGQAQRREQPAVINLSAGSHMGPHDGSTLVEQALDTLLETPGRAFCAAAGNEGIDFIHWGGFELEADSVGTYFYMDVDALALGWIEAAVAGEDFSHGLPIDIGLYGTADAGAELAIGFEGMGADFFEFEPLGYEGQTPWRSAGGLARAKTTERDSLLYGDGRLAGIGEWAVPPWAKRYRRGKTAVERAMPFFTCAAWPENACPNVKGVASCKWVLPILISFPTALDLASNATRKCLRAGSNRSWI